jgi:hypothetical protein
MNFETQQVEVLEFLWGPADGRRYPVAKVREWYQHEMFGEVHEYVTEPEPRGSVWVTVHRGVVRDA